MSKRVLLTGVGGFIGAHCLEYFLEHTDWYIIAIDSFRHKGTLSRVNEVYDRHLTKIASRDDFKDRVKILYHDLVIPLDQQLENKIMDRKINDRGQVIEKKLDYIINMASDSAVERSTQDPVACLRNNYELAINMLEFARKIKPKIFYQVSCYDEKTRILTPDGFKTYNQIKIGDIILSLNSDTKCLEEKKVEDIIVQDYEGEMYSFNYSRINLKVTPNHRMFFENKKQEICVDSAENLSKKTYSYKIPKANWCGKKQKSILVPGFGEVLTEDLFYLCGLYIGDGFFNKQIKKVKNKSGLKRKEFLKICRDEKGRFKNIGKIGLEDYSTCNSYRIWIDIPFNDPAFLKCCNILDKIGIKYTTPKNKSGEHIYFSSKSWIDWFKQFGIYAKNKQIPYWMLQYDKFYLEKLLEGLIDSDGHTASTCCYSTCSEKLTKDVCELALKLGYFPHFKKTKTEAWFEKEKRIIKGTGYNIHICKTHPNFCSKYLSKENYSGKVWCLKVQDNKNLIVERDGKIAICGNTDEVYGQAKPDQSHVEWDVIMPSNPYAASKASMEAIAISYWRTYDVPVVITNTANNIGEWQDPEKFLPKIIQSVAVGKEVPIYGDSEESIGSRIYLHAKNHADVFLFLSKIKPAMYNEGAERPDRYNVCGDIELNNLELAKLVAEFVGKDLKYKLVPSESARKGYDKRYALDGSKLTRMGWVPPITFRDSIKQIVDYTLANPHWSV